jgi:predicted ATPase
MRIAHATRRSLHRARGGWRRDLDLLAPRAAPDPQPEQTFQYMLMADARLRLGQVETAMAAAREGLTRAECTGERVRNAELHRLTAACHRAGPGADPGAAEVALQTALRVAREQGARMWELRAACDLARLWAERGERQKAHELLAPVYGWFTEGFNTPDLKAAKVVLDELRA